MVNRPCAFTVPVLAFLAGCGGDAGVGNTPPPVSYAAYAAQDAALRSAHSSLPYSDPASLPGIGSASYSGVMVLEAGTPSGPLGLSGGFDLTADFAASTISGQAGSFADDNNIAWSGSLPLTNGQIDRLANPATEYTLTADLAGTISGGGNSLTIAAALSGDFLGAGHDAVQGVISGTATGASGSDYLFGDFIAEK